MAKRNGYGAVPGASETHDSGGGESGVSDMERSIPQTPRTPDIRTLLLPQHAPRSPASASAFSTETGLTVAEQAEYERGLLTWDRAKDWRYWVRWAWAPWYVLACVLAAGVCLVAVFHREIIERLMPFARYLRGLPFGWTIPIAIMVVLSFPPLFGNEILIILCGVVWGVWRGFAIAAAGTVIGEMACFTVFHTCYRRRAYRLAHMNLNYACLSRVITNGGLFIAWVVRLSAIPTHVSTLIFAVCGLHFRQFLAALILSLPKQSVAVYLGVMVTHHKPSPNENGLSYLVVGFSVCITLVALHYVYRKMLKVRKEVFLEMREDLIRRGIAAPLPPETDEYEYAHARHEYEHAHDENYRD